MTGFPGDWSHSGTEGWIIGKAKKGSVSFLHVILILDELGWIAAAPVYSMRFYIVAGGFGFNLVQPGCSYCRGDDSEIQNESRVSGLE